MSLHPHLVYQYIKTPLHSLLGRAVADWRNETNSIGRRLVCGVALAGLAIAGIIDMIAGIAIGILSFPLKLYGYQYSRYAFERVYWGGITSIFFLSTFQLENILGKTL